MWAKSFKFARHSLFRPSLFYWTNCGHQSVCDVTEHAWSLTLMFSKCRESSHFGQCMWESLVLCGGTLRWCIGVLRLYNACCWMRLTPTQSSRGGLIILRLKDGLFKNMIKICLLELCYSFQRNAWQMFGWRCESLY